MPSFVVYSLLLSESIARYLKDWWNIMLLFLGNGEDRHGHVWTDEWHQTTGVFQSVYVECQMGCQIWQVEGEFAGACLIYLDVTIAK